MAAGKQFSREPADVPLMKTANREIKTKLPVPESIAVLENLEKHEPMSMQGQPPIIWDKAEGFNVYDPWGNKWIDWSCGVLITNIGHGRKEIIDAIQEVINKPLLATYCFPNLQREKLVKKLAEIAPAGIEKAFVLTTGSEGVECAIKLARTRGLAISPEKKVIVTFEGDFHGRTLASQLAGGIPALKEWCLDLDSDAFVQVPWPGDFRVEDKSFEAFLKALENKGVSADRVCAVMCETYQGGMASFAPKEFMQQVVTWVHENDGLIIYDEVQAGFGRTGKFWGFEHYETEVDLICCGKGISSSLPISAVLGKPEIMDQYAPGSMTSTHAAAPLGCAASLANIDVILKENLVEQAAKTGEILKAGLEKIAAKYPDNVAKVNSTGMVAAMMLVKPGTVESDNDSAHMIVEKCFQKGLLMFAPVGPAGMSVKIAPPLNMPVDVLEEALGILEEAFDETLG